MGMGGENGKPVVVPRKLEAGLLLGPAHMYHHPCL